MTSFELGKGYTALCEFKQTRNGFKHVGKLYKDWQVIHQNKVTYLNRTWERYEFETCLKDLIDSSNLDTNTQTELLKAV